MAEQLSDTNINQNIFHIGQRRERRVYYRPDGTPTGQLPADGFSQMHYLSKGFKLNSEEKKVDGVQCPLCEFVAKNALGLRTHLTNHVNNENKEEKE